MADASVQCADADKEGASRKRWLSLAVRTIDCCVSMLLGAQSPWQSVQEVKQGYAFS